MSRFGSSMLSFFAGAGLAAGASVMAAPGDLVYTHRPAAVQITKARAAVYASLAIDDGAWDGAAADMENVRVYVVSGEEDSYYVSAMGTKTAPAASLPVGHGGVKVIGIVE